jgi:hypothetical protein
MEVKFNPSEMLECGLEGEVEFEMSENDNVDSMNSSKSSKTFRKLTILSKEVEEQIENLEQKLKIARRKGRKDKMKKITDKIDRLRSGLVGDDYEFDYTHLPAGSDQSSSLRIESRINSFRTKKTNSSIIFSIQPRSIRTVLVSFRAINSGLISSVLIIFLTLLGISSSVKKYLRNNLCTGI